MYSEFILCGRLAQKPEVIEKENIKYCNLVIGVKRPFRQKETSEYKTDWVTCVMFGAWAQQAAECLKKGDLIMAKGRIETSKYEDKDGREIKTNSLICERTITLSQSKKDLDIRRTDSNKDESLDQAFDILDN